MRLSGHFDPSKHILNKQKLSKTSKLQATGQEVILDTTWHCPFKGKEKHIHSVVLNQPAALESEAGMFPLQILQKRHHKLLEERAMTCQYYSDVPEECSWENL